ncbi:MAG: hypothetical protein DRP64_04880 [Verrucomicrobia bacterium]|nr:MAG: hypothetical protein DRP64_04880 [Verrucomicrobiota bacterium]
MGSTSNRYLDPKDGPSQYSMASKAEYFKAKPMMISMEKFFAYSSRNPGSNTRRAMVDQQAVFTPKLLTENRISH